jgi:endo-1,4-beta-xylanase
MQDSVISSPSFVRKTAAVLLSVVFSLLLGSCGSNAAPSASSTFRLSTTTASTTLRDAAALRGVTVGAAVSTDYLNDSGYDSVFGNEFSQLEAEWEMKFATIHPRPNTDPVPYDFSRGDRLVDYALVHHMQVRGHTLLWHRAVPQWLSASRHNSAQLASIAQEHIASVIQHFGTNIYAWDVLNEAFNDDGSIRSTLWYDSPGIGYAGRRTAYIEQAFVWAHDANPNIKLFYNDYAADTVNRKSDAIYSMAIDFKKRGVPLHGIGFQMHLDLSANNNSWLSSVEKNLKRFADLGLEIHITELDIRLNGNDNDAFNTQAELYSKIAKLCVTNPKCKVLQTWGFTDRYSWIPSSYRGMGWALPFDSQYIKKPAYYGLHQGFSDN